MKTTIITIFAALTLTAGIAKTASASTTDKTNVTVLNDMSRINKIEIHGNVEVFVSNGAADEVKVYNKYYAENALVQNVNGTLRISSYKAEKLVVWVTANDLRTISAFDNSSVRSFGNLSNIELDVDLHNTASANLDLDAFSANVTVADHAKAELKGKVEQFNLNHNLASSVNNNNLTTVNYTEKTTGLRVITVSDELAGLL